MSDLHFGLANYILDAGATVAPGFWDRGEGAVLDFGCEKGLTSRELAPHTRSIVGIDIDPEAVEAFNTAAEQQGLTEPEMHAYALDILKPGTVDRWHQHFDAVVSTVALHHVEKYAETIETLVGMLKPEGVLYVVEMDHGSGLFDHMTHEAAHKHGVKHHGLDPEDLKAAFLGAGLEAVHVEQPRKIHMWVNADVAQRSTRSTGKTKMTPEGMEKHQLKATVYLISGKKPRA